MADTMDPRITAGATHDASAADGSADPFALRSSWVAALAKRVGITEGQLYSTVIGVLVAWAVSANAFPYIAWDSSPSSVGGRRPAAALASPHAPAASSAPDVGPFGAPQPDIDTASLIDTTPLIDGESGPATGAPELPAEHVTSDAGPLRVTEGGYASANAGTPLASVGVPTGSVAVSRRAGATENVAYLRLAGRGNSLDLAVDTAGTNTADALAGLQLCVITERDWKVGHGDTGLAEAPPMDCANPISGVRADDGTHWSFDVTTLDLDATSGVAITPIATVVPPHFQVVFKLPEGETP